MVVLYTSNTIVLLQFTSVDFCQCPQSLQSDGKDNTSIVTFVRNGCRLLGKNKLFIFFFIKKCFGNLGYIL